MFIKSKRIKLMSIVIVLLITSAFVGKLENQDYINSTRTINGKIDIGGYKLNVNCYGKGNPTVIFESGLGGSNYDWEQVQPQISKITRTFSYDRAGIGGSDKSKLKRTSLNQVHELHTLLKAAKVKAPYVIVAHSIGGYNARLFAGIYPKEVAGIVFVDSSHENQLDFLEKSSKKVIEDTKYQFADTEQSFDEILLSAKQVKDIRKKDSLRNIPIIVLSADEKLSPSQIGYNQIMKQIIDRQKDIASLSNKSKYIFVKNSGHYIQLDKPQVVIDAIKEIINKVKK